MVRVREYNHKAGRYVYVEMPPVPQVFIYDSPLLGTPLDFQNEYDRIYDETLISAILDLSSHVDMEAPNDEERDERVKKRVKFTLPPNAIVIDLTVDDDDE